MSQEQSDSSPGESTREEERQPADRRQEANVAIQMSDEDSDQQPEVLDTMEAIIGTLNLDRRTFFSQARSGAQERYTESIKEVLAEAAPTESDPLISGSTVTNSGAVATSSEPVEEEAKRPSQRIRSVTFHRNLVEKVAVYEKDDGFVLAVSFRRHWAGWVALLVAMALDTFTNAHAVFVCRSLDWHPVAAWFYANIGQLTGAVCVAAAGAASGLLKIQATSVFWGPNWWKFVLLSVTFALQWALRIYAATVVDEMVFFTTLNLHLLWILVLRKYIRSPTFFTEWAGMVVAVIGYVLCSIPTWKQQTGTVIKANVVLLVASGALTAFYLLLEHLRPLPSVLATVGCIAFYSTVASIIMGLLYVWSSFRMDGQPSLTFSSGHRGLFDPSNSAIGFVLGGEGGIALVLYLYSLRHLDVMTLGAGFVVKTIAAPYILHYWLKAGLAADKVMWGTWFFVGTPFVLIGCVALIIFASVKRQFIIRRVQRNRPLRRPGNPYQHNPSRKGVMINTTPLSPASASIQ